MGRVCAAIGRKRGIEIKRTDIISTLKKMYNNDLLSTVGYDGPTAMFIAVKGKNRIIVLNLSKSGESIIVTVGRFFKRRYTILLNELRQP
jgi:hypothetical protein